VALGFGAQNLVKDFIAGLFMLLEDQYGVGDVIDVGEASGTVEAVGLRITTIRDGRGVLWYIRNGEIVRVGNKSQGWALVVVDVPIGFAGVEEATSVLRSAASTLAEDPEYAPDLLEAPAVLGVEQITVDGAVVRTTMKTASEKQWSLARELRRRLTEALESAGITAQITSARGFVRPRHPTRDSASSADPGDHGVGGAT
jgi:small conductance mechanosensitive channel